MCPALKPFPEPSIIITFVFLSLLKVLKLFINDYFDSLKLEEEVLKLAKTIASKSTKIIKMGKEAFYKQLEMPLDEAYKYTSKVMCENMLALDAQEGISAFLEKRAPEWKNK